MNFKDLKKNDYNTILFTICSIQTHLFILFYETDREGEEREGERDRERRKEVIRERKRWEREGVREKIERERRGEGLDERDNKILKEKTILRNLMFSWKIFSC